jgi:hypothetical protein
MKTTRKIQIITFFAAIIIASSSFAQQTGKDKADMLKVSIEAKISYVQRTGYYMATTDTPHVEYFIINPAAKTLDKLIKDGKPVKINGHLTVGADQLFVERINGKQYPPAKQK